VAGHDWALVCPAREQTLLPAGQGPSGTFAPPGGEGAQHGQRARRGRGGGGRVRGVDRGQGAGRGGTVGGRVRGARPGRGADLHRGAPRHVDRPGWPVDRSGSGAHRCPHRRAGFRHLPAA
jgi:hypothetical protein